MTDIKAAAERIRRIRAGVEKSQDIYGVTFDEKDRKSVHEAATKVKRLMLDDENTIVDAYLAECREPMAYAVMHKTAEHDYQIFGDKDEAEQFCKDMDDLLEEGEPELKPIPLYRLKEGA